MPEIDIPGYRIERELGHGGMATVYLAEQLSLNRQVALKVMAPALAADRDFAERFTREAKLVARLSHPHIVAIYDIGIAGAFPYLALEYIGGGDLKARMAQGAITPQHILPVIAQVASALGHAHQHNIVHRDIKPENILFRADGSAVLGDFGIARAIGGATRLTGTGLSIGSPHYMSPEQARGQPVDGRADLYALGIVLYEALTGQVPYDAEDTLAIGLQHLTQPVPELPPALSAYQGLLDRLLAKDPNARYRDAAALSADIQRLQSGGRISRPVRATQVLPPTASPSPAPSPWAWGLGGAALAALLALGSYLYATQIAPRPPSFAGGGGGPGSAIAPPRLAATQPPAPSTPAPNSNKPPVSEPRATEPEAAPEPPPPPAIPQGFLQVITNAPNTEVFLNGQRLGRASPGQPLEYRDGLPVGSPELTARAPDHQERRRPVTIRADKWTQVSLTLEREGPDLDAMLAECRAHMAAQEYTNPEDDNALLCYQGIERLDPGNREVTKAFEEISAFYLESGQRALQAGDRERVKDRIERLRQMGSDNRAAARLEERLANVAERPVEPSRQGFEPEMVSIRGGCYQMGSPTGEDGRGSHERQHRVCVDGFKIGKFEVTQAQWEAVMGSNPSHFSGCANCPVEKVSWNDVQDYIGKLNARTGQRYRLPTEAEWEYAARAGSTTAYPWGNSIGRNRANCDGCGSQWDDERTAPVGSFQPNAWGLYDTAGNVWEWTCSAYDKDYGGAEQRCVSKNHAGARAFRGGSWYLNPRRVRSALRYRYTAVYRLSYLGFRLAQD